MWFVRLLKTQNRLQQTGYFLLFVIANIGKNTKKNSTSCAVHTEKSRIVKFKKMPDFSYKF